MAPPATTTKGSAPSRSEAARKKRGQAALKRLEQSLDDAQKSVADLGQHLSRGGRDLVKDVKQLVSAARRDTRKLNKRVMADLEQFGAAFSSKKSAPRSKATTGRATPKKKTSTAAKR